MTEKQVYINGDFLAESEAKVSATDLGFYGGDGIYEVTRTFGHQLFRLDAHLDRLERSLAYIRLDCGLDRGQLEDLSREIITRNKSLLGETDEYALWHVITRGGQFGVVDPPPTVVMHCVDVNFKAIARGYLDGLSLVTPGVRRTSSQSVDPRAKVNSRMNQVQATLEAKQVDPGAIPLLLDLDGNLAETNTANFFFVSGGKLFTPMARNVLGGITRLTVLELAAELGIEATEGNFTPYDVYTAEEAFTTGTSATITPVKSLNGKTIGGAGDGNLPGPVTLRLIKAFSERAGVDFAAQALGHLGGNEGPELLAEWTRRLEA